MTLPKKLITIILLAVICCTHYLYAIPKNSIAVNAQAQAVYAYMPVQTTLYKKTDQNEYKPLVNLPRTYFVKLLSDYDETQDYIAVEYADLSGYVLSQQIEPCDFEPVTKYATASIRTNFDNSEVRLRRSPQSIDDTNNIEDFIPHAASLHLYGSIDGSEMFDKMGTTWHYVRYMGTLGTKYGYVYSAQATPAQIPDNIIQKVENDTTLDSEAPAADYLPLPTTMLILSLCTPAVLIIFVLCTKPPIRHRTPRHYNEY